MRHTQRPGRRQVQCIALMVSAGLSTLSSAFVCRPNSGNLPPTPSISSATSFRRRTARTSMLPANLASLDVLLAESSLAVDIPVLSPTSALEAFAVLAVPLLLFAGLQLTRQDDRNPKNADDPINEMSTNDILTKLFAEVEGKEPTSMFSSSSTASPLIPVKLEARGGAGGGKGSSVLERPPAPSPVDEEVRQTKLRVAEEEERVKTAAAAAAAAAVTKMEEDAKATLAAAAQKAADMEAAHEKERVRKEMKANAAAALRAVEDAKAAKAEAEAQALKEKQAEEKLEMEMRKQREMKAKEEAEKMRITLEARAAAAKAKREQEKKEEEKRKLVAQAAREAAAKKEEEQEKRMIEIRQQQELAKRAERIKLELERAQKEKEEKALQLQQQLMREAEEKEMQAKKQLQEEEEKKVKATAIAAAAAAAKAAPAAAATTTKAVRVSKAAVMDKNENGREWEEMRRLERESLELLSLSPSTLRTGGKAAFSPEGEFIKRGKKTSVPAREELVGAAGAAVGSPVVEKKLNKEEAEKERKELLMGLDAVMQDLQRRAEEKKGSKVVAKDEKITVSASASSSNSKKAPAKSAAAAAAAAASAAAGASLSDPTAVAKKLTIPKLKGILDANGVKSSSRAKKEELVRLVVGLAEKNQGLLTAMTTKKK